MPKKGRPLLVCLLVMNTFLLPSFSFAQPEAQATCPVMPGHRAKGKFFVDFEGRRIFLCCRSCQKAFRKHPERYLKGEN